MSSWYPFRSPTSPPASSAAYNRKPVFATLEQALVIKTLGRLSPRDQQMLQEAMTKIVG